MSPAAFELELLERRRRNHWRRLARPREHVVEPADDESSAPFASPYPHTHLALRALLPLALAIVLFLVNHVSSSDASNPRGTAIATNHLGQ